MSEGGSNRKSETNKHRLTSFGAKADEKALPPPLLQLQITRPFLHPADPPSVLSPSLPRTQTDGHITQLESRCFSLSHTSDGQRRRCQSRTSRRSAANPA